jgi:hypothetical protein
MTPDTLQMIDDISEADPRYVSRPPEQIGTEEGDTCGRLLCRGTLYYENPDAPDCHCSVQSAPCYHCRGMRLICNECDYDESGEDGWIWP